MPTLTPAYGKDHKSAKAAKEAFASGADFILHDMSSPWDGKPCNIDDLRGQYATVNIRYAGMRKVCVVKVSA